MKVQGTVDRTEGDFFVIRSKEEDILVPKSLFPGLSEGDAIVIMVKRVENKKEVKATKSIISGIYDEKDKK